MNADHSLHPLPRGISLLELILTLALFAILASSTLYLIRNRRDASLRRIAQEAASYLQTQSTIARVSRRDITVRCTEQRGLESDAFAAKNSLALPSSITCAIRSSTPQKLTFRSNGTASPGSLLLTSTTGERCIVSLALRGQLRWSCEESR